MHTGQNLSINCIEIDCIDENFVYLPLLSQPKASLVLEIRLNVGGKTRGKGWWGNTY